MAVGRLVTMAFVLILTWGLSHPRAQQNTDFNIDFAKLQVETVQVTDGLYVLTAPPLSNVVALIGNDGVLLVDTMAEQLQQKLIDAVRKLSTQPIRYVITTHLHGDHTGGNAAMAKLGAVIISHENVRQRMINGARGQTTDGVPTVTYSGSLTLHFNNEDIHVYHPAPAHTDGDSIVYFRTSNVLHVGDIPSSRRYPNISVDNGGTVDGMVAAAKELASIVRPDTKIIPGHLGPIVGLKEVEEERVMLAAVRDRVAAAIKAGKTEAEVIASKPTTDFDEGRLGGLLSPDRFVSLVYRDLSRKSK